MCLNFEAVPIACVPQLSPLSYPLEARKAKSPLRVARTCHSKIAISNGGIYTDIVGSTGGIISCVNGLRISPFILTIHLHGFA